MRRRVVLARYAAGGGQPALDVTRLFKRIAGSALGTVAVLVLLALCLGALFASGAVGHASARGGARARTLAHARRRHPANRARARRQRRAVKVLGVALGPAPVRAHPGSELTYCPSRAGLERFAAAALREARSDALAYGRVSLTLDLSHSDRAWQPQVRAMWKTIKRKHPHAEPVVLRKVTAAGSIAYRIIVRRACGAKLIGYSLVVTIAPVQAAGEAPCEACDENFFVIDRRGRAFIYFVY